MRHFLLSGKVINDSGASLIIETSDHQLFKVIYNKGDIKEGDEVVLKGTMNAHQEDGIYLSAEKVIALCPKN